MPVPTTSLILSLLLSLFALFSLFVLLALLATPRQLCRDLTAVPVGDRLLLGHLEMILVVRVRVLVGGRRPVRIMSLSHNARLRSRLHTQHTRPAFGCPDRGKLRVHEAATLSLLHARRCSGRGARRRALAWRRYAPAR
jgi:hypothetical protein